MNPQRNLGKVYLVGAGPGDPELLTLKAYKIIQQAEVIIYDALLNPEILKWAPPYVEKIFVGEPRQKERLSQKKIQRLMILRSLQGKTVVRLKGGDPFIFGRGGEEALALEEAGIEWEVVPGISAGCAVPAYAGIPLTHRGYASSVAFITGHECQGKESLIDWKKIATSIDTLVIFMGTQHLSQIVSALTQAGRSLSTPIAIIEKGTSPEQRVHTATLGTILDRLSNIELETPGLIVVGEVVKLEETLSGGQQWEQTIVPKLLTALG